jgi:hypothetical protein
MIGARGGRDDDSRGAPVSRHRIGLLTAALGLAGAGAVLFAALDGPLDPPPTAQPGSSVTRVAAAPVSPAAVPARQRARDTSDRVRGPVLDSVEPSAIRIRTLGVSAPLMRLGLDASGALEVPGDAATAGWFTGAPAPGALGPAVIAGHVSWNRVPGVFYRLGELRAGDRVEVVRRDGRTVAFAVSDVRRFAKSRFPTEGGHFDDNVVVFAWLVDVR